MSKIVAIDPRIPDSGIIMQAAELLRQGGLLVFPTHGLYGLGADAGNPEAVARIFRIKRRDPVNPLLVLIDQDQLEALIEPPNDAARHLMRHFWPGKLTLVLHGRKGLAQGLTSESGKIGVRRTAHPVARALVSALGRPLTGTSANISGAGGISAVEELDPALLSAVDMVLDAGPLAGGIGSTVVDATSEPSRVLREGIIPASEIERIFKIYRNGRVDNKA